MKHPVSGELKELSKDEFIARFDESVHSQIEDCFARPGVKALVLMENLQMDSSSFGAFTALTVGPGCTYKLQDVEDQCFRLGSLPSTFQYPTAISYTN